MAIKFELRLLTQAHKYEKFPVTEQQFEQLSDTHTVLLEAAGEMRRFSFERNGCKDDVFYCAFQDTTEYPTLLLTEGSTAGTSVLQKVVTSYALESAADAHAPVISAEGAY